MQETGNITVGGSIKQISMAAKDLIKNFEDKLSQRLTAMKDKRVYTSLDDILISKYNLTDIETMPGFENKKEFITKGVRGNIPKAQGKILTYEEAEDLIQKAVSEELP